MGGLSRREVQIIAAIALGDGAGRDRALRGLAALLAFAVATVALAGLAHLVSLATEQVGERFGPAATGVLQSTLGNLPEFFVVVFALRAGEVVVAQTSIIGSLLANALLVLGLVIVVGARSRPTASCASAPGCPTTPRRCCWSRLHHRHRRGRSSHHEPAAHHERAISTVAAVALLLVYLSWVVPYVAGRPRARRTTHRARTRVPLGVSVALLAAGGAGAAFVSDWFIAALRPTIDQLGVSEAFAGLVVVAIAGNAVENVVGARARAKGRVRPRDLRGQELRRAGGRVPVSRRSCSSRCSSPISSPSRSRRCSSRRCC